MRALWSGRQSAAPEGGALGIALTRIRAAGEGWAAAQAEQAFRQVLVDRPGPDHARTCLERIAAGPDPRAALIAQGALRLGQRDATGMRYSAATDEAGAARK